jgi:hypothetical protein
MFLPPPAITCAAQFTEAFSKGRLEKSRRFTQLNG